MYPRARSRTPQSGKRGRRFLFSALKATASSMLNFMVGQTFLSARNVSAADSSNRQACLFHPNISLGQRTTDPAIGCSEAIFTIEKVGPFLRIRRLAFGWFSGTLASLTIRPIIFLYDRKIAFPAERLIIAPNEMDGGSPAARGWQLDEFRWWSVPVVVQGVRGICGVRHARVV